MYVSRLSYTSQCVIYAILRENLILLAQNYPAFYNVVVLLVGKIN